MLSDPAVPRVQRGQVHEEDPDRGGLRVAGQSRPPQASGELAQAARQQRPDPLVEEDGKKQQDPEEVSEVSPTWDTSARDTDPLLFEGGSLWERWKKG